jgi:hypothetical protein
VVTLADFDDYTVEEGRANVTKVRSQYNGPVESDSES